MLKRSPGPSELGETLNETLPSCDCVWVGVAVLDGDTVTVCERVGVGVGVDKGVALSELEGDGVCDVGDIEMDGDCDDDGVGDAEFLKRFP